MSSDNHHHAVRQVSPGAADTTIILPKLLTQRQLCQYLHKSEAWAERARLTGDGPPYTKVGRSVRYPATELLTWLDANRRRSTSDAGEGAA
jgi:predicted DNA-binding transcriptional regulator AlpA